MAWQLQTEMHRRVELMHCSRDHQKLKISHRLAKQEKMYGWDNRGNSTPVFSLEELM